MLQGGPGSSSSTLEQVLQVFAYNYGSQFDVCTLDHRGVDRSSSLGLSLAFSSSPLFSKFPSLITIQIASPPRQ